MRIPLLGFLLIVLNIFTIPAIGQEDETGTDPKKNVPKEVEKANAAYDAEQYSDAIELLKDALTEVKGREDKSDILFKIAESYRKTLDYTNAAKYYESGLQKFGCAAVLR